MSRAGSALGGALIATGRRATPVGLRRNRKGGKATGGVVVAEQGEPSQGKSLAKLQVREGGRRRWRQMEEECYSMVRGKA